MNGRVFRNFWIGFVAAAAATVWIYWLRQQQRELSPPPVVVRRQPSPVQEESKAKVAASKSDDLEQIKGIGPVYARRLRQSGIETFAQLASQTADELQKITGATSFDPADWIAEARQLS